jgi:Family of unknown function (DUF6789)
MADRPARIGSSRIAGAVVAGFVGTVLAGVVLLFGYAIASVLAGLPGDVGRAFEALIRNTATSAVEDALGRAVLIHVAVGLALAVAYAAVVEPRLSGPGWRRGVLFALVPWLLSLLVLLPALGGGLLGLSLGAGLLPVVGNLIAHLVYGTTLGWLYERQLIELGQDDEASALANLGAEWGTAVGVVGGGLLGATLTVLLVWAWSNGAAPLGWAAALGGVGGATVGGFVGSFAGLGTKMGRAG